jgi:PAS domain S-box-containing protein
MVHLYRKIEDSRTNLEAYLGAIASHIRMAVLDQQFKITWVNDQFCTLLRYDKPELLGRSIGEFCPCFHEAGSHHIIDSLLKGQKWSGEIKSRTKDGEVFWVKTNVLPIPGSADEFDSFLVINSNITATKLALEEKEIAIEKLLQSEARYRALVENQSDLISLCDAQGYRKFVNSSYCNFLGKPLSELIGTNISVMPFPGVPSSLAGQVLQLSIDNPEIGGIYALQNSHGQKFWISLSIKGIFDTEGKLYEILTIGRDVTELKNAELQKTNYIEGLEQIAFMTSHNVRAPIATMLGLIELLKMDAIERDQWARVLDSFKSCVVDLDRCTKEMAAFIYHRQSS